MKFPLKIIDLPGRRHTGLVLIMFTLLVSGLQNCVSVESYQRIYLNDRDMQLQSSKVQSFENDSQSYREGASGGNAGKTGGGCGCN